MNKTIAVFQTSTDEDLRFQLQFSGLSLSGRTLAVYIRESDTNTQKVKLTLGSGLTLVGSDNLTASYARSSMSGWARKQYSCDVVDETGGSNTTLVAVRVVYDEPGRLPYGVRGNQATVKWEGNQAVVTAIGGVGPPGPGNSLTIGDVETLETGEDATASITGDTPNQVLNLGLPKGDTGTAATVAVGSTTTGIPGSDAEVVNSGTSSAAVFDFTIPAGVNATIEIGDVTTGVPGSSAEVSNSGTTTAAVLDFTIPRGDEGEAATIAVGSVTTSLPGSSATVTNSGTSLNAVLDFVLPRGDQGPPGSVVDGDKGDIAVSGGGTVWTIDNNVVTNAKLANMANGTFKLRKAGTGTGAPIDATATEATAELNAVVGDSGSGGTKGLVPAPSAGDAAAGKVLGAGGGWVNRYVPRGHKYGLTLTNNTSDATNDIDIAAGEAASDDSSSILMVLASAITKRLDAAWAVGSGNGGWLDGASMPNGTGHAFLIRRPDTGVVDVGFSASLSPTLPTNYTQKARIGSIIRASSAILPFIQTGRKFRLVSPPADISTSAASTSGANVGLTVPSGIPVEVTLNYRVYCASNPGLLYLRSPGQTNSAPIGTGAPLGFGGNTNFVYQGQAQVVTDTSSAIGLRVANSSTEVILATIGWDDFTL